MLFTAVNHRNHTFRINIVGAYINRGGATVDATTVQWRRSPSINYSIADKVVRTRPIPTFLLKEMVDVLLPYVTAMINASLREGRLPSSHRHAVVTPLLKSSRLDADERKNYRPVSNLSSISKLTERAVSTQIVSHLTTTV